MWRAVEADGLRPARCFLVQCQVLFRQALRSLLEAQSDLSVVGEAGNTCEAVERALRDDPDLVILDHEADGERALETARRLRLRVPDLGVLFLTGESDESCAEAFQAAGRASAISKSAAAQEFLSAVRFVYRGREISANTPRGMQPQRNLTPREFEVLRLVAEGNSVKAAAAILGVSAKTAEAHKFNLMRKLELHNRAQLVTYAIQKRVIRVPVD